MQTGVWIVLIVLALIGGAAAVWAVVKYLDRQRSYKLREKFGPEYSHAVEQYGDRRNAEKVLEAREQRVEKIDIRALSNAERDRFTEEWQAVQADFVDDPKGAVERADRLVREVMKARGYPVEDFEQSAADISVHHPHVVQNYRMAHGIAERHARGEASTEDLRKGMVYYRDLFEDLLEVHAPQRTEAHR